MHMYHFVTEWFFDAPVEEVWEVLSDFQSLPQWWPDYKKLEPQDPHRTAEVGAVYDVVVKGSLPYSLRFSLEITKLDPPFLNEHRAAGGLVGTGKWTLVPRDGGTEVKHFWDVGTTNPLLNFFARFSFAERMLAENHTAVMARGYEGLKARLAPQA